MTPEDANAVAQAAAKAANLAAAGHEKAFHSPEAQAQLADQVAAAVAKTAPPVRTKPLGLLRDPAGDVSSKRTESLIALLVAIFWPVVGAALVNAGLDVTKVINGDVFVGALLGYSAAMQGVAWAAERGMP